MTPESQRIAIAEACGWRRCFSAMQPKGETEPKWWMKGNRQYRQPPNYPGDLNACYEMERTLKGVERHNYGVTLADSVLRDETCRFDERDPDSGPTLNGLGFFNLANTPAAQRCEAFLRTKGLWVEG